MLNPNSLRTNLLITVLMAVMVFVLPWLDRWICRRLGLNLQGGLSENENADRLLRIRRRLLIFGFLLYLLLFAWLVFFSRVSSGEYTVHIAPLENVKNAFSTPTGFSGWFKTLFTEGVGAAFSQISIVRPQDLSQFYMNMMLFVPMGYLLPYIFRWFRAKVNTRPVLFCLLLSIVVENLQLITRRGLYDFDDIIANTLGGWIGQMLYIAVGYVVTHPRWRRDLKDYRRWYRAARKSSLYPYAVKSGLFRTTLLGTDPEAVRAFYVEQLGFRPRRRRIRKETGEELLLFEMGKNHLEVFFPDWPSLPEEQYLTLSVVRLPAVRKRLEANSIDPGPYRQDPSGGMRMLEFPGPDNVRVRIVETE